LFALGGSEDFGRGVAAVLGQDLAPLESRSFEDGEHKLRPLTSVRGQDCYVLHALHGDEEQTVNDKLCRLLFFAATLRDHGAWRVTVACPYLAYARKDRRTKTYDPITARYVAQLIEAMGVDRVAVLEPHSPPAFDNSFRIPAQHLHARAPLADALLAHVGDSPLAVVSPDTGGAKRAAAMRQLLAARTGREPATAFLDKHRSEGVVTGDTVAGEVEGCLAVIVDDLIASGTTIGRAAHACRERGATGVYAVATHAVFSPGVEQLLQDPALDLLLVTDSVAPRMRGHWGERVERVSVQPLFAAVIRALHEDTSVTDVLEP
jgi:ribose-phosphate pyrophosphokinase